MTTHEELFAIRSSLRRVKLVAVAALAAAVVPYLTGAAEKDQKVRALLADTIGARSYFLVSKDSKPLGGLWIGKDGQPELHLVSPRGGSMTFKFDNGGVPSIMLADPDRGTAQLACGRGSGRLSLMGPGKSQLFAIANAEQVSLQIGDETGMTRAVLGSATVEDRTTGLSISRPHSSAVLINKAGNVIWSAPK